MAPRTLPPAAKQALILTHFHKSGTAHTIKELEKALPSIASINSMHVKDYLSALSDEGKIRVEKIGSGNWYWSFAGEERGAKEGVLRGLREEKGRVEGSVWDLGARLEEVQKARAGQGEEEEREELVVRERALGGEVEALRVELNGYSENDPEEVERRRAEVELCKVAAERWTDNVLVLEGYLGRLLGGDRVALEEIRALYYGVEYVEGEGLREL
ncbi:MAG: hypothetical protein M1830_010085 [Pleopsidium flavum]|nr:MAG: hypothetical protein M1830_010085 [Pleopsidium flavum]